MFLLPIMSVILHRHDSYSAPSRLIRCTITTYILHHHDSFAAPSQLLRCTITTFTLHRHNYGDATFLFFNNLDILPDFFWRIDDGNGEGLEKRLIAETPRHCNAWDMGVLGSFYIHFAITYIDA